MGYERSYNPWIKIWIEGILCFTALVSVFLILRPQLSEVFFSEADMKMKHSHKETKENGWEMMVNKCPNALQGCFLYILFFLSGFFFWAVWFLDFSLYQQNDLLVFKVYIIYFVFAPLAPLIRILLMGDFEL